MSVESLWNLLKGILLKYWLFKSLFVFKKKASLKPV